MLELDTKICSICKQEKPRTREYFHRTSKGKKRKDGTYQKGWSSKCKPCAMEHLRKYQAAYRAKNKEIPIEDFPIPIRKSCLRCKKTWKSADKIQELFILRESKQTGMRYWNPVCEPCRIAYRAQRSQQKKRRRRKKAIQFMLGSADDARRASAETYAGVDKTCAVLNCDESGNQIHLHHLDYNFALDVVPLCSRHHRMAHKWAEVKADGRWD